MAVTKLDVLDGCQEIKLCTGYRHGGKLYTEMPADLDVLFACEPVYETFQGWMTPTTGMTSYKQLPLQAKRYLARVEEVADCPIDIISTGSRRSDTIILRNPMTVPRRRRG
jgi:adenylosuccinate synthase